MSHELSMRSDGTAEMAYTGAAPWHRLGKELPADADIETWRKAAGFDFDFELAPACFLLNGELVKFPGRKVVYRGDNNKPMSMVSDQFKLVQPGDVLSYFADLAKRGGFQLNTAGLLFGGKQFWALADIGADSIILDPNDKIRGRVLMATSVDLSLPTTVKFVAERVVCHNTLTYGMSESGKQIRVRHRTAFNPEAVNAELGIVLREQFEAEINDLRALAAAPMDDMTMISTTIELFVPEVYSMNHDELMQVVKSKPIRRVTALAIEDQTIGASLTGCSGTAWGWLNAVTQYVDHESGARSDDKRLAQAWFGSGDRLKGRALDLARAFVSGGEKPAAAEIDSDVLDEAFTD